MRHARQSVELDVLAVGVAREHAFRALAQVVDGAEVLGEALHGGLGNREQFAHRGVATTGVGGRAALLHLAQAVLQRLDQHAPALGVVDQVVFKVRVSLHDPDVAEHLV